MLGWQLYCHPGDGSATAAPTVQDCRTDFLKSVRYGGRIVKSALRVERAEERVWKGMREREPLRGDHFCRYVAGSRVNGGVLQVVR